MRSPTDDSLTGLDTAHRGRLPRGGRQWAGSLGQRARASRGLPQAVVKISSYSHSAGAVASRLAYIGREGELELEGPTGKLLDEAELAQTVAVWDADTEPGRGRRFAMSALVSFPAGVDQAQATEAARQFFREAFAENHDYVFAAHTDTENFHVHVVVEMAGQDGKQLRIGPPALQAMRELFAEKAREAGIELDASPRWARGLEADRQPRLEVEGMARRGVAPAISPEVGWSLAPELREQWDASRAALNEVGGHPEAAAQALAYARAAAGVAGQISKLTDDRHRVAAVKGAVSLARFGWDLAEKDPGGPRLAAAEDREEARRVIDTAERALRFAINRIDDPQAKREAIEARQTLYTAGVQEYREAKREAKRELELEKGPEKDKGLELDPFD